MKLYFILAISILGYTVSSNLLLQSRLDDIDRASLSVVDNRAEIEDRFQRIMDRYGTRLTLVEKGVKKYHGVATLEDLTERK